MREHPPMSPDDTVAWFKAALDGKIPANRVLLRRVLRLAILGAACEAGQTANKNSRDAYWTSVVEDCERFPGIKGRREACRMAAKHLGVNEHTLRGIAGSSPQPGLENRDA